MKKLGGHSKSNHSLSDWLVLHELDTAACYCILDAISSDPGERVGAVYKSKKKYDAPDSESSWLIIAEAIREFLPEQKSIIDDTFQNTLKIGVNQRDKPRKALTLDNGPMSYPTILHTVRGEPSDSLIMAHELGHAVQIRASQGKFVTPIIREVCAFLGEGALLAHAMRHDAAQYRHLVQVWQEDNDRYFREQKARLRTALSRPDAAYKYFWNYPIARYLAIQIAKQCPPD